MRTKDFDQKRRNLAKSVAAGVAAAVLPASAKADPADTDKNIVFSEDNLGHWKGVEALHVPIVTVSGDTLTIKTPHPVNEVHFIASHTVVLEDGTFLSRRSFSPDEDPVSEHKLPAVYRGRVTVTSTCNVHDFWVKRITV
jgi:superoxide reductase